MVNQVKAFFVREFGKYFIFKFSLFATSPASVWYLVTCLTVISLVSQVNLVNLGTSQPLGNFVCRRYSDIGETKLGLWSPTLSPFWAKICSTTLAMLLCPTKLFC